MKKSIKKRLKKINERLKKMQDATKKNLYYQTNVLCLNCKYRGKVDIRKGLIVEQTLKEKTCPECKCKTLIKF